jgi:IS30 family transposase
MNYTHLTIEERTCIYQLKVSKVSIRQIAKAINRAPSTVSRELKRNGFKTWHQYHPTNAQKKYEKRRRKCHRTCVIKPEIKEYIESKLHIQWSPEQIAKRKQGQIEGCPCFSTIYRWIHQKHLINGDMTKLRRKGKFKRPQETRGRFNIGKTIKKRPKEVYTRQTIGHWEADTVESGRINYKRKSKYCFVTLAERKSRLYLVKLLPDRTSENVTAAIVELLSQFPSHLVKTITCDRGKEFAQYKEIEEKLNCDMYFADPYCAWQKGTNENSNGLLREYYPKGMDLSLANEQEVTEVLNKLHNRPRKCINFKTPLEVINESI